MEQNDTIVFDNDFDAENVHTENVPLDILDSGATRPRGHSTSPLLANRFSRTMYDVTRDMVNMLPSHNIGAVSSAGTNSGWIKTQRLVRARQGLASNMAYLTLRKPTTARRVTVDAHAAQIAAEIEKDETLMDDSPVAEQLRMETLREMPESLSLKRNIKARLSRTVSLKSQHAPVETSKNLKHGLNAISTKLKSWVKTFIGSMELWYNSIKVIEGHFGSGVATYFTFLRWLLLLNTGILIVTLGFLVSPQLIHRYYELHPINQTANTKDNITSGSWEYVPRIFPYQNNTLFQFGNLFTGEGWLTDTELFYGAYFNQSVSLVPGRYYNIPNAYFFSIFICYLVTIIILSVSMAKSYRKSFIETSGGMVNVYAFRVFCGWDYSIVTEEAAQLKSQSIFNELRELLQEEGEEEEVRDSLYTFILLARRGLLTLFVIALLVGSGVLVWFLLDEQTLLMGDISQDGRQQADMMMSLVVTFIMLFLPMIFTWLSRFEHYSNPRNAVFVTLLRTFGLVVAIVGVLIAYWLRQSHNGSCWETSLGQEVYRLIIVDFFVSLIGTSLAEFVRARIYRTLWKGIGAPEFDIARNTLNLIYNQTLFWVGFYLSPLLSVVIVVKMLMTFFIKRLCVLHNCSPPSRSWRAAQTQTIFLVLTFLAMVGVLITHGYILTQVKTSECGPFNAYNYTYEMILEDTFKLKENSDFWKVLVFLTKPGLVAGYMIALCVVVYYMRAVAKARQAMIDKLRDMLVLEAKDKDFLLRSISKVSNGHWIQSPAKRSKLNLSPRSAKKCTL